MIWAEFSICIFLALGTVGWQTYTWLKFGAWVPLSLVDLLAKGGVSWAEAPEDWFGLHHILNAIPLTLFFFAWAVPSGLFLLAIRGTDRSSR